MTETGRHRGPDAPPPITASPLFGWLLAVVVLVVGGIALQVSLNATRGPTGPVHAGPSNPVGGSLVTPGSTTATPSTTSPSTTASPSATTSAPSRSRATGDTDATGTSVRSSTGVAPTGRTRRDPRADVVALVNQERAAAGCRPVRPSAALARSAQDHSAEMARYRYVSSTGRDGSSAAQRIWAAGWGGRLTGENVTEGPPTGRAVMSAWLKSAADRDTIRGCGFTAVGVGYAESGPSGRYWTIDFGG